MAFEVQLSPQTPGKYFMRSQRYFESALFPVWLVPRQLEPHNIKVPVVVTGFGKESAVPDDASELLDLPAGQDFLEADDRLGAFVEALLRQGHSWKHGTPEQQADAYRTAEDEAAAAAEAERLQQEILDQQINEMNDRCASPESAFGPQIVRVQTDTFVWGTLTCCWNCEEPMLVWDARRPGFRKRWARIPRPDIKAEVRDTRIEDQTEVHRAVDDWTKAVESDIPKAVIKLRRTKAAGRLYKAFVCPGCDSTMGQFFISRIRPEKWSILSGPNLEIPLPSAGPQPRAAADPGKPGRCRIHSIPRQWCDWCQKRPTPRLGNPLFKRR